MKEATAGNSLYSSSATFSASIALESSLRLSASTSQSGLRDSRITQTKAKFSPASLKLAPLPFTPHTVVRTQPTSHTDFGTSQIQGLPQFRKINKSCAATKADEATDSQDSSDSRKQEDATTPQATSHSRGTSSSVSSTSTVPTTRPPVTQSDTPQQTSAIESSPGSEAPRLAPFRPPPGQAVPLPLSLANGLGSGGQRATGSSSELDSSSRSQGSQPPAVPVPNPNEAKPPTRRVPVLDKSQHVRSSGHRPCHIRLEGAAATVTPGTGVLLSTPRFTSPSTDGTFLVRNGENKDSWMEDRFDEESDNGKGLHGSLFAAVAGQRAQQKQKSICLSKYPLNPTLSYGVTSRSHVSDVRNSQRGTLLPLVDPSSLDGRSTTLPRKLWAACRPLCGPSTSNSSMLILNENGGSSVASGSNVSSNNNNNNFFSTNSISSATKFAQMVFQCHRSSSNNTGAVNPFRSDASILQASSPVGMSLPISSQLSSLRTSQQSHDPGDVVGGVLSCGTRLLPPSSSVPNPLSQWTTQSLNNNSSIGRLDLVPDRCGRSVLTSHFQTSGMSSASGPEGVSSTPHVLGSRGHFDSSYLTDQDVTKISNNKKHHISYNALHNMPWHTTINPSRDVSLLFSGEIGEIRSRHSWLRARRIDQSRLQIVDVWADNLEEEFARIRDVVENYQYIAMDTEFPGIVARPTGICSDYQYKTIKFNVDLLKVIQLGISFADERGNSPSGTSTWQFNFKFDLSRDMYAQDSIDFLKHSGIDFETHQGLGIDVHDFGELIISSGLVMNTDVKWISFHGSYDFGYLVKLLTNDSLPSTELEFFELLRDFFPSLYDIKYILQNCPDLNSGISLQKVSEILDVKRIGPQHQAGSDSLVTCQTFFRLMDVYFDNSIDDSVFSGVIYGLGNSIATTTNGGGRGGSSSSSPLPPTAVVPEVSRQTQPDKAVVGFPFNENSDTEESVHDSKGTLLRKSAESDHDDVLIEQQQLNEKFPVQGDGVTTALLFLEENFLLVKNGLIEDPLLRCYDDVSSYF